MWKPKDLSIHFERRSDGALSRWVLCNRKTFGSKITSKINEVTCKFCLERIKLCDDTPRLEPYEPVYHLVNEHEEWSACGLPWIKRTDNHGEVTCKRCLRELLIRKQTRERKNWPRAVTHFVEKDPDGTFKEKSLCNRPWHRRGTDNPKFVDCSRCSRILLRDPLRSIE